MYCPKCGKEVQDDDIFCRSCGNRIQAEQNSIPPSASSPNTNFNTNQASIQTPMSSEEQELCTFVGSNADFYLKKWKYKDKGWNWAAFFCVYFWLAYRKMYLNLMIVFLAHILAILLYLTIITSSVGETSALLRLILPFVVSLVSLFIFPFFMGFYGNRMYYNHATRKIEHIKSKILNEAEREKRIRRQGGVGVVDLFLTGIIFILIVVLLAMIEMNRLESMY
ncbi:hypothetical protein SK3146_03818 [Paenibacillus konkukensis]|uniref:Zinc-ribbon domain-containing protein n=1 Tax=Paenibacillus konkukensis TaxID=2020716 RepID=A0ABY4RQW4_9BACL|nr:DUF2628 domain-containing protein [Paenibacillus konkukensis]UQZ84563.1 hypothetical protein SK3146_03818 [Paenibacillus konkukensis]